MASKNVARPAVAKTKKPAIANAADARLFFYE
jgi:hypothetical protein